MVIVVGCGHRIWHEEHKKHKPRVLFVGSEFWRCVRLDPWSVCTPGFTKDREGASRREPEQILSDLPQVLRMQQIKRGCSSSVLFLKQM